ncbi:MAG TPA: hypothetical protein PK453_28665, partial [Leptospiraceae bacterium]|nr:hypothetical protein [Leptospiraceae bacterium]
MKLIIILLIVFNITIAVSADDFYKPAVSADSPIMNTATFSENFRMGACCEICNAKLDKDCLEKDHIFAFIPVNQCKAIQISKKRSEYGGQAYFMDWQKLGCNDRLTSLEKVCSLGPNLWKGTEYEKVYTPEKCSEALKIRSIPDKTVSLKLDLIISKNLQSVKDSDSKLYSKIMKELNSEKEKLIKDFNLRFAAADKKDRDFQRNNFLKSLTEYSKCENSDLECQKVVDLKKRERYLSSLSYNSQCESKDLECIKIVEALKRKVFLSTLSYNSQCENNDKECQDTVNHLKRKEYLRKLTADSSCYSGDEECKNIVNKHREKEKLKKEKELAAAQRKYK